MKYVVVILCISIVFLFVGWNISSKQPSESLISPLNPLLRTEDTIVPTRVPSWSMVITGDIIPARVVNQQMTARNDFHWPLRGIKDVLLQGDITLIDLEAPLLYQCPLTNEGFTFCGDGRFAQALKDAGVDVANIANNHTLNYGWEGISQTEELLDAQGILTTGFGMSEKQSLSTEPCEQSVTCSIFVTKIVQGVRVGFLGYNAVGQQLQQDRISAQIRAADAMVDVLVVSVHWGKEYERYPTVDPSLAPDDPVEWGRYFVDWGADVVVGNHPHWYQSMEWYKGPDSVLKPIFYALGNTVFDQEWSPETKEGVLIRLTFTATQITDKGIEIFPIGIRQYGEAYLLEGIQKENILNFYAPFLASYGS